MNWTTKATIQRMLAAVPAGRRLYYLGQRYGGGFRHFTIDSKIKQGLSLLQSLFAIGEDVEGRRTVEIGTGWAPVVPLLFWAYGQAHCDTYDVSRLLKDRLVVSTVKQLVLREDQTLSAIADPARQQRVGRRLSELGAKLTPPPRARDILEAGNIAYHGAADASNTNLPDGSVDLVYSNVVLEHVPPAQVDRLFREAYRILRPNGFMVHLIDPSDHFSHSDASISSINFLRFSEAAFTKYNSTFLFQNRLRAPEWRRMIERHRFAIDYWRTAVDGRALAQLPDLPIDQSFSHLAPEDLCTTSIWVVARRLPALTCVAVEPELSRSEVARGFV